MDSAGMDRFVHQNRAVDDGIEPERTNQLGDHRMPGVGVDELGPIQADGGVGDVDPEYRLDFRMRLQAASQLATKVLRHTGYKDSHPVTSLAPQRLRRQIVSV
jgi:hypothetical protein